MRGSESSKPPQNHISPCRAELVNLKRLPWAGCEAFARERRWRAAAPPAEVKDSTGAGDAFVAAFLVARLARRPIERCLAEAAAAGAAATEFIGGQPEIRGARG